MSAATTRSSTHRSDTNARRSDATRPRGSEACLFATVSTVRSDGTAVDDRRWLGVILCIASASLMIVAVVLLARLAVPA